MAEPISLRDYQRGLSAQLADLQTLRPASKLGILAGTRRWLVDLVDTGEVIPLPKIATVPLTRAWYAGVANVRGNLYSVTDLGLLLGAEPVALTEDARLLLVADRFRAGAGFLVERAVGLRNVADLKPATDRSALRWVRTQYTDAEGRTWKELDIPALIQDEAFLEVSL